MPAHSRIDTLLAKRHDISYELFVINCIYIVSTQISTDISKKTFIAPVNVSRACITIQAGYVCVVRSGTAQDQAHHLPPNVCHGPKTSGSWRRTLKLFLGLRLYPKSGAYPLLGVTTLLIGNSGAAEPVKKWVRKLPWSPKSGCAKLSFLLLEAQKVGAQLRTLRIRFRRPCNFWGPLKQTNKQTMKNNTRINQIPNNTTPLIFWSFKEKKGVNRSSKY